MMQGYTKSDLYLLQAARTMTPSFHSRNKVTETGVQKDYALMSTALSRRLGVGDEDFLQRNVRTICSKLHPLARLGSSCSHTSNNLTEDDCHQQFVF